MSYLPPTRCECGVVMRVINSQHLNSVLHIEHERIRALLKANCLGFAEIGKRFGITREMVRQINMKLGLDTGFQRQDACRLIISANTPDRLESKPHIQEARRRGMQIQFLGKEVFINGKSCRLLALVSRPNGACTIHRSPRDADFGIWASGNIFVIIPFEYWPATTTMFMLHENEGNRKGAYSRRHDFRNYINAWHLLEDTNEVTGASTVSSSDAGQPQMAASSGSDHDNSGGDGASGGTGQLEGSDCTTSFLVSAE